MSGVRSSCDTFETKSLCSRDRFASRRTNTQTRTTPVTAAPRQREDQDAHQEVDRRFAHEQEHHAEREQERRRHDHQRHQQEDDAPIAEQRQVARSP